MSKNKFYVYKFLDKDNKIIYVGKTKNLNQRIHRHFSKDGHLSKECYENVYEIEYCEFNTNTDMTMFEVYMINKYRPIYNIDLKYNDNMDNCIFNLLEPKWNFYNKAKADFYHKKCSEKVICLTTNLIFENISKAEKYYNIKSHSAISHACLGKLKSAGKDLITGERLRWAYYKDYLDGNYNQNCKSFKFICLNNKKIFNNLEDARKFFNLNNVVRISNCLNKVTKSGGKDPITNKKLIWMYYDEYLKLQQIA